jgi:tol-pal system protein YbgF
MRRTFAPALLALALFAQLAASPARGALFDDEEARRRIESLRARVEQLEATLQERVRGLEDAIKSQGLRDLLGDIEQIKNDVAKLRGQNEVLTYELEQAQKRQRDLYLDLDGRLRRLESASSAGAPQAGAQGGGGAQADTVPPGATGLPGVPAQGGARGPLAQAADVVTEQRTYDAALDQFKSGNYPASVTSFQNFARAYPKSALAPSALYWAGNAQYAMKDYRAAIATQRQLVATYPDSQKVPDALLNIASSYSELRDNAGARRALEEIVKNYPGTEAAGKAKQRLSGR